MQFRVALGSLLLVAGVADVGVISLQLAPRLAGQRAPEATDAPDAALHTSAASVAGLITQKGESSSPVSGTPTPLVQIAPGPNESTPRNAQLDKPARAPLMAVTPASSREDASTNLAEVQFEHDSADLDQSDLRILASVARTLKRQPLAHVLLRGHSNALGSEAYNHDISGARAERARGRLIELGIAPERIRCEAVGEAEPVPSIDPREAMRMSRRVQILLQN